MLAVLAGVLALLALGAPASALGSGGDDKRACAYTNHSIAGLQAFGRLVHRTMDCAVIYTGTNAGWTGWEDPWFLHHAGPDADWAAWATAPGTARRLIITQDLFPSVVNNTAWRAPGAAGAFTGHARTLAHNLVAAGLGGATIRLAPEANGTWYPDSIGNTAQDFAQWRTFWRLTVLAMRSVPGAHFQFDWCVHMNRPLPLTDWYPGDDVVDFVGIDTYDIGLGQPAGATRWSALYNRPGSISAVVGFAQAHNKLLSIPEWGLSPVSVDRGGGDDPTYVDGIASVVRHVRTSYQAYFYKYNWASQLSGGQLSLGAYRRHFGNGGDTVPGTATPVVAAARSGRGATSAASRAAIRAELRTRVNALARAGFSALVRHGKLRRTASRVLLPTRSPVGATVCLIAVLDRGGRGAPSALALRTRGKASCATNRWIAIARRSNVLAVGSRSLASGRGAAHISVRLHGSGLRYMRKRGFARLTVIAVIVPHSGSAVVASVQRRSVRAR